MYIYILSDPIYSSHSRYKFGITSRRPHQLIRDYLRYLPQVEIVLFEPCRDAIKVEAGVKRKLGSSIVTNRNGNPSEWVAYPLPLLIEVVKREMARRDSLDLRLLSSYYRKIGGTKRLRTKSSLTKAILEHSDKIPTSIRRLLA
jgi:hypothetical protein